MIDWTVNFFILSVVAGVLGFSGIAAGAIPIGKICSGIFLIFFMFSLILHRPIGD